MSSKQEIVRELLRRERDELASALKLVLESHHRDSYHVTMSRPIDQRQQLTLCRKCQDAWELLLAGAHLP